MVHPDTPVAISNLLQLTHLELRGCGLPQIGRGSSVHAHALLQVQPQLHEDYQNNVFGLRKLTLLQHLELCGCQLHRSPDGALTDTLVTLSALTYLDLSNNALSGKALQQLFRVPRRQLCSLLVAENAFSLDSVLAAVPVLPGVCRLDMGQLAVGSINAAEGLSKLSRVRTLAALTLPIGAALPDGGLVPSLAAVLKALTGLTELDLEGPLDDMMLLVLAPALERLSLLQSLSLDASSYLLDEETMHHREAARTYHPLQQALAGLTGLRNLTFSAGEWTFSMQQTLHAFAAGLAQQPHLTRVHLKFTHQFANRGAYKVLECVKHVPGLQHLQIQTAGKGVGDIEPFIAAVQNLTNLEVLDLRGALDCSYYNGATLQGISQLQKLRLLDVSSCSIRSACAVQLAVCLAKIKTVENIDISGNELSYNGAHALAQMMKHQACVEVLDLAGSSHMYNTEFIQLGGNFPFINW